MGNRTEELQAEGTTVLLSFEEAIGFCVGDIVRDKDGVCASAVFMEMASHLASQGVSVSEHYEALCQKYGHYVASNGYFTCTDTEVIDTIFKRLREEGGGLQGHWGSVGGTYKVAHIRDLTTGFDSQQPDQRAVLPVSPGSHMITYTFENGAVLTLRTSGTEPKIKYYLEAAGKPGDSREGVTETVNAMAESIIHEMLQPHLHNLS